MVEFHSSSTLKWVFLHESTQGFSLNLLREKVSLHNPSPCSELFRSFAVYVLTHSRTHARQGFTDCQWCGGWRCSSEGRTGAGTRRDDTANARTHTSTTRKTRKRTKRDVKNHKTHKNMCFDMETRLRVTDRELKSSTDKYTYLCCRSAHVSHHPAWHARLKDVRGGEIIHLLQWHLTWRQSLRDQTQCVCVPTSLCKVCTTFSLSLTHTHTELHPR